MLGSHFERGCYGGFTGGRMSRVQGLAEAGEAIFVDAGEDGIEPGGELARAVAGGFAIAEEAAEGFDGAAGGLEVTLVGHLANERAEDGDLALDALELGSLLEELLLLGSEVARVEGGG
jgi:hypothetical protein